MSWFQALYETYERFSANAKETGSQILPILHTHQNAHIEITIDGNGNFRGATVLDKENTIMPSTEDSAARTKRCAPHGLADKIQYCAKDYKDYGGKKAAYFDAYYNQLRSWCDSKYSNIKVCAVLKYIEKGTLIKDLIASKILWVDETNKLLSETEKGKESEQKVFKFLQKGNKIGKDQGNLLVRWRVQIQGDMQDKTWDDDDVRQSWVNFISSKESKAGLCYVTGEETNLAQKHPNKIRNSGDTAKIISANDKDGYTYLGRFENSEQALGVGFNASQKAHAALAWLIDYDRDQAYRNGSQVFVAWAKHLQDIPKFYNDSFDILGDPDAEKTSTDIGMIFSQNLAKKMKGYTVALGDAENIIIIGIDSATTGRLSIIYYKELKGSDFLERIEKWHRKYAWKQYYGKDKIFYGAASPADIANVAYGNSVDDKIIRKTIERILPCIIENKDIPNDIVDNCVRQASNPIALEYWQWQKALGIACALYSGNKYKANKYKEDYKMSLDTETTDRNYLYGRLLALIDCGEIIALNLAGENRETNARKYMRLFSMKPNSTWKKLYEMFNLSSRRRLLSARKAFLKKIEELLEEVHNKFIPSDYHDNSKLNGDYLLGYYCQLSELRNKKDDNENNEESGEENN